MRALTLICLLLVASKFGTSLAHVAELPGKLRLDEATYKAVQGIYYPGFTLIGLVGELGGILALAALLYATPNGDIRFWWSAAGLAFLLAGHVTYWFMTHPVNKYWVKDVAMAAPGTAFFSKVTGEEQPWTRLRDRWERSHVIIAVFATLSLISIATATSYLGPDE